MPKCPAHLAFAVQALQSLPLGHPSFQWPPLRFPDNVVPSTAAASQVAPSPCAPLAPLPPRPLRQTIPASVDGRPFVATQPDAQGTVPVSGVGEPVPFDEQGTRAFVEGGGWGKDAGTSSGVAPLFTGNRDKGLFGQPSAASSSQEPSIGKVILESEEAKAKREAEKEVFEFKAPTELATQLPASSEPITESLPVQARDRPGSVASESALGSDEGSMDVLLEALGTMQEGVSTPMPEQGMKMSCEGDITVAMKGVYEDRPQRLDTPEYRLKGAGMQVEPSTQTMEARLEEPMNMPQCQEVVREVSDAPSSPGSHKKKKRGRRSGDLFCFFCKNGEHRAVQCPKFLKDKATGKVTGSGGLIFDRQRRVVERTTDRGRAQLYRQNQEEMSE
ncbi:hypothetical protein CBR_g8734 [Chara braunii]|uniref:Uncharacterized protein n=1 Tax=Chara braunii TaxID=69332 RepID=A0A388KMM9_CHABU|nr:hypothetical protein CBR_g8734 [Chara braunii]|eukprot:GBG71312.1 hypothetical protein CBR_g8734 [Chara braunii]